MFVKGISINPVPGKNEYLVSWEEVSEHGEHGKTKVFKTQKEAEQFIEKLKTPEAGVQ